MAIEDEVGARIVGFRLDHGDEIFGLVVDGAVGAEFQAGVDLVLRADGHDHFRAERFRKLDRHGADAG